MKLYKKLSMIVAATAAICTVSCKKVLDEVQRTNPTQDFLGTPNGVIQGITGAYWDMRNLWGTEGFTNTAVGGTDEVLAGGSASGTQNFNYRNLGSSSNDYYPTFQLAYQDINTLNGVLKFGPDAYPDAAQRVPYLAQAKFMRGFLYLYLVNVFGGVPLHTEFITEPTTSDTRASVPEVLEQAIKDFTEASTELQVTPSAPFAGKAATRATALLLLGKAYLCRGWFYSYPAPRNPEPNPQLAKADFDKAAEVLSGFINDRGTYGIDLWEDFADVHKPGNEYGKETLFVIDHNSDTRYGNFVPGASGGNVNGSGWFFRPNYPTVNANYPSDGGSPVMTRDIPNGRPFIRIRPNTNYIINQAFAERSDDSRYDKTFQTVWIANTENIKTPRGTLTVGADTAIWMPPYEVPAARRTAFKGIILTPAGANGGSAYTPVFYPSMKKYDDPNRPDINDPSTRPFIVYRFADAYLLAAEAYFKAGDPVNAAAMLNVIRKRAAYSPENTMEENDAAKEAMTIGPSDVTIDFILDERTRELYGEYLRWTDLTRTNELGNRLQKYNATEAYPGYSESNPKDAYMLRPIPQNQIDLVTTGPAFPQNPGY